VRKLTSLLGALVLCASCASRESPAPLPPMSTNHPEYTYPAVPEGTESMQATRIERGWRYLQADSHRNAEREFQAALKMQPSFPPAETGLGYLEIARDRAKDAVAHFDRALEGGGGYVPALIGRGQALLELGRDADALTSFEAALKADPARTDLQSRIDMLRFRSQQDSVARAKAASEAGRWDEARAAYGEAISASPDSAFLYRELALVERKANVPALALEHFRRAVTLDPSDARSWGQIGELLQEQGDLPGALSSYEKAHSLDPTEVPNERLERLRDAMAIAKLPEQYRAISASPAVTRGDVAALIGVRLSDLLAKAQPRQAVITDTRGHWAHEWILPVVRSGVMDTQPNYTFQPTARVRRGDLAQTVSRVLSLIAAQRPASAKTWQEAEVKIADVAPAHLNYAAVAQAVASGVMPLTADGTFQLLRPVTGAEVDEVVARLEALADAP
jgi:tetratricopeptide (TPR) repeat protein